MGPYHLTFRGGFWLGKLTWENLCRGIILYPSLKMGVKTKFGVNNWIIFFGFYFWSMTRWNWNFLKKQKEKFCLRLKTEVKILTRNFRQNFPQINTLIFWLLILIFITFVGHSQRICQLHSLPRLGKSLLYNDLLFLCIQRTLDFPWIDPYIQICY